MVTGPPAVGKTTLARSLAAARNPSVHLHADDFWGLIVNGYVDPWLPAAEAQNEIVLRAACGTAADLATGGYHVVYDGVSWALVPGHLARSVPPGSDAG